jgi:uncharacterized protein (TIGR02611 family)
MAAITHFHFLEDWRELLRGQPGKRFQARYERAKREQRCGAGKRVILIVAALICVAIGIVLVVMPGPAFVFFILAGGLLATESQTVARFMDWSEVSIRKVVAWAKRRWRRLPVGGRIVVILIAACGLAAAAYLGFRLLRS